MKKELLTIALIPVVLLLVIIFVPEGPRYHFEITENQLKGTVVLLGIFIPFGIVSFSWRETPSWKLKKRNTRLR